MIVVLDREEKYILENFPWARSPSSGDPIERDKKRKNSRPKYISHILKSVLGSVGKCHRE
jgi:hypothetical protein